MNTLSSKKCQSHDEGPTAALSELVLFRDADPAFLTKLNNNGNIQDFSKGHVIFLQDDLAEWFYVVLSGWVKLFRQTLDGDEVIVDVLPAGTIFGETDLFDNKQYSCSAEVVQDAKIAAYPISILRNEIATNQTFSLKMLKHLVQGQREKDKEIEHRTIQNAPQRLGCFLLRLIPAKKANPVVLHLPYDKTLIASRLGMQSETFSRALARLKDDLGLKVSGSTIEIKSMDELISYTCSACSNAYPCED
ncbi:MAG: Crp/Fnr family transcriptional regulator [Alphaproteobacteria bacterium]|nr:Crp/Fnr family transcriptional regulator [Alphaproteobacteria bacterium]